MPEKIVCSAKAFPEPGYSWAKEDDPNNTLSKTNSLSLNVPISRKHAGNYICTATNRHGSNTAKTILNVMCKSQDFISQSNILIWISFHVTFGSIAIGAPCISCNLSWYWRKMLFSLVSLSLQEYILSYIMKPRIPSNNKTSQHHIVPWCLV